MPRISERQRRLRELEDAMVIAVRTQETLQSSLLDPLDTNTDSDVEEILDNQWNIISGIIASCNEILSHRFLTDSFPSVRRDTHYRDQQF